MPEYDALRIRLERVAPDSNEYRVHAASATGEVTGAFTVPVSELELDNLVLRMNRARSVDRGPGSTELQAVKRFGSDLFSALFTGAVRDLYRDSYSSARQARKGLRITLSLTKTPELMDLPWEYLYERPDFISISTWTPVVRYLEIPRSLPPLEVTPPLRVLGLVSSPSDVQKLDVDKEKGKLDQALANAVARGAAEIHWVERATLSDLGRALRLGDFHVFHYIGHGAYDPDRGNGVLLLEGEDGKSRRVGGENLATMLADEETLRLAVLN
ncbi:MAG: CHAT domain-containing protein, partial [Gaiellaceae bacterium]